MNSRKLTLAVLQHWSSSATIIYTYQYAHLLCANKQRLLDKYNLLLVYFEKYTASVTKLCKKTNDIYSLRKLRFVIFVFAACVTSHRSPTAPLCRPGGVSSVPSAFSWRLEKESTLRKIIGICFIFYIYCIVWDIQKELT